MKRGRKWGPAARPATPGCFPTGRLEVPAGPGRAMAPWRKTDKERHGVGKTGPRALGGTRAGGKTAVQEGAGEPAVWTWAPSATQARRALSAARGPRGGNREARGEEGGTAPSRPPQPTPSPAWPPPRGCPLSPSACAFPRWVPAERGATWLCVRLLASQGFPHPFWRPVLLQGASSIVLSLGWALPDPMSLPPPLP